MRPLKLTMQAFGPYAGKEVIDFTVLGSKTMFVISGKTGAGKTTIFDGISFAIYGKASGEDRSGTDLRSQFAEPSMPTEVTLEFILKDKTYYIVRNPQQMKKKERGDGTTTVSAKAELYLYDENGNRQLLAANVRDVDEKIKEIMIIDSNQFRQILMIPQGEFRKLLTSDSKDKELILQRLFHTEFYKRIEEKLKEEASDLKKMVDKQLDARNLAMSQIHAVFSPDLKANLEADSVNDSLILPLLEEEINWMAIGLEKMMKTMQAEQEKRSTIQQQLYKAETIVKQLEAKEAVSRRKAELLQMKDEILQMETAIALARKAAVLAQQEELCHHLKRELDDVTAAWQQAKMQFSSLAEQLSEREKRWLEEKANDGARTNADEKVNALKNMKEDIHAYATLEKEVQQANETVIKLKDRKSGLESDMKNAEKFQKTLADEKEIIERQQLQYFEQERKLEKLEVELSKFTKFQQQKERYSRQLVVFERAQSAHHSEAARLADARATVAALEEQWMHAQASILAGQLQEGEKCPVCGSAEHPELAVKQANIPDERDLKAAKAQVLAIESEKVKAESAFYEAQSTLYSIKLTCEDLAEEIRQTRDDFTEASAGNLMDNLKWEQASIIKQMKELESGKKRLANCIEQLKQTQLHREQLSKSLEITLEELNTATVAYTEKRTNLVRITASIPEDLRSISAYEHTLRSAISEQETLRHKLEEVLRVYQETKEKWSAAQAKQELLEKNAGSMKEKLDAERAAFVQKMNEQGFHTYNDYANAKKMDEQIKQLEASVREYHEEFRSVHDRLNELTEILRDVEMPDLEKIKQLLQEADNQLNILQQELTNLTIKKRDNEAIIEKVVQINNEIKHLENRYALIGHLAEISKGQNTYRITFERFVLASFLDDILKEANGRLTKMTSGRYELLRKTDRSKGNVQSGLELLVFDQYTGQERHVKTLSGGESFKAALSLALGLADVVQAYAGGVSLETMFIDEGFGTLDPESLDQAIESLIDIQSSGRLVGVISHVPELKERIDARLEVTAAQTGSKTEFLVMN